MNNQFLGICVFCPFPALRCGIIFITAFSRVVDVLSGRLTALPFRS